MLFEIISSTTQSQWADNKRRNEEINFLQKQEAVRLFLLFITEATTCERSRFYCRLGQRKVINR